MKRAALLFLAGCDLVYGLEDRADARIDTMPDAPPEACPADGSYVPIPDAPKHSTYRIVETNRVDWQEAFDDCRNDTDTGVTHLIVFDDSTELTYVQLASPTRPPVSSWVSWGGYARNYDEPPFEFTSVTGIPLDRLSTLWAMREPDNGGMSIPPPPPETAVWWGDNITGLVDAPWDDTSPEGYICECDGTATKNINFRVRPPAS